jgi:spore germination protein YaaH
MHDHRVTRLHPVLLLSLLLPLIASACITVENEALASPTASPAVATPVVSPTTPGLASPTPSPSPQPTPQPVEAEIVAFMPNWLIDDVGDAIDTELVTIAAFHSIEASGDGRLVRRKPSGDVPPGWAVLQSDAFSELKARLQSAGVKVVPVIQRVAWTEGTRERTITLLSRPRPRRALAERIAAFVSERGFDGVNLDVEPLPAAVADDYVQFVREVRAALDEVDPGLHLSIDVVPGLENYDLAALTADDAADLAVIMGYGYRTGAAAVAGSTAPLRDESPNGDLARSVEAAIAQASPESIVLALPWYGLAWSTQTDEPRSEVRRGDDIDGSAQPTYAAAVATAAQFGRLYEPGQASAWSVYATRQCPRCPPTWRQVWYDDPDSFGTKIDFALQQGLAGVGIWGLGMEAGREEMWWALRDRLRPRVDERPPFGSPALDPEALQGDIDGRAIVVGTAPLRLLGAADDADGSGLALARIGLSAELDGEGMLVTGRTYPAVARIDFPLGDESTGGSAEDGPRSIHVQWRDLAGNWSAPVVIEAYVLDPVVTPTPDDLEAG